MEHDDGGGEKGREGEKSEIYFYHGVVQMRIKLLLDLLEERGSWATSHSQLSQDWAKEKKRWGADSNFPSSLSHHLIHLTEVEVGLETIQGLRVEESLEVAKDGGALLPLGCAVDMMQAIEMMIS